MGETEETQQDNTSVGDEGTTSKEPVTFTEEQVKERERKTSSDVSAELGRVKKLNEGLIKSSQAIQDRLNRRDKEEIDRELETHKDDPAEIRRIRAEQETRRVQSELTEKEQELDVEKGKTAEAQEAEAKHTKERNAREVASRLGVEAKTLIKFTDGSVEAMEDLAKSMNKENPINPDSSKTTGSNLSDEKIREAYRKNPQDPDAKANYLAFRRKKGI